MRITSDTHLSYPELTLFQALEKAALAWPASPALEFYGRKISFASFREDILTCARALAALGVKAGDTVTICLPNVPQAMTAFYAVSRLGAAAQMLHPQSARKEIEYALRLTACRLIITLDMFYETVIAAVRNVDPSITVIVARTEDELPAAAAAAFSLTAGRKYLGFPYAGEGILWKAFMKTGRAEIPLPEVGFDRSHTGVYLWSGGTSGSPKAIALSDYSFNACAVQARAAIDEEFGPGLSMLSCMPCFHGFGLCMNLHAALIFGVCCLLMPSFNIKTYAKTLIRNKPNYIAGVPTIFDALLGIPNLENADLSFLKGMFCGGDTLPIPLKQKVDAFLAARGASIQIREGYGLTECVTACCLTPKDESREGSIGLPFPDTDYRIVKPGTAEELPAGETGEIILTGPTLMQGYLGEPEETADALRVLPDGRRWLYTGDLGCIDGDGFVYFRGRIKRMIITNGFNVYPITLEQLLLSDPEVKEACVVGVPDPRRMHKVKAVIVPAAGADEAALRSRLEALLTESVARYALPREYAFVQAVPRTVLGKIDYRKLEEE